MTDEEGHKYLMATKEGFTDYYSFHESLLIELVDFLHDNGYKINQCAGWYWRQQMFSDGEDKDKLGKTYYLDEDYKIANLNRL